MKSEIKILVFEERAMKKEGVKQWRKKMRHKLRRIVFVPLTHVQRLPVSINTRKKLGIWMSDNFGAGTFVIRGWTKGYTKTRVKFVRLARLKIKEIRSPDVESRYNVSFYDCSGISRYKFWLGND